MIPVFFFEYNLLHKQFIVLSAVRFELQVLLTPLPSHMLRLITSACVVIKQLTIVSLIRFNPFLAGLGDTGVKDLSNILEQKLSETATYHLNGERFNIRQGDD